jgi:transcriptional regulator with XRE-family HTH domain
VPTRPSQNDPRRVVVWEQRRRAVGDTVRRLRLERGLTQEQLASTAGMDRTVLIALESGRRSLLYERLFDIADALNVSLADLVENL